MPPRLLASEREDLLPVVFHVDDGPALCLRLVERLVELADRRIAVVGPFAHARRCDARSARSAAPRRPLRLLQHLQVAIGIAEGTIGRRPICSLMPTGLPGPSSMKSISGSRMSTGLPSRSSNLHLGAAADDLLGRNAVDLLRPRAHELDAAAGDDEGLEAVRAQVGGQFEHRLIDHLGKQPLGDRDASRWRSSR